jgi:phosphoglycolate phosphatase
VNNKSVVIFDFDGTLADSFLVAMNAFCEATRREPMPREDISRLRGMGVLQLLRELEIPLWRVPFLAWRVRQMMHAQVERIDLVPGVAEMVRKLARQHQLFIVSSNSPANIRNVLRRFDIADCFADIYGDAQPLRKYRKLRKLLGDKKLAVDKVWYIGDTTGDIEAAHIVGAKSVAVSWGYNNIAALERHRPDKLVFSPEELVHAVGGSVHGK